MGSRNASPLDDNAHRRGGTNRHWLEHNRSVARLSMRRRSSKILIVRMAQCCHMIPDHQDKFISQLGQCTNLHAMAGAAKQLQGVFYRPLVGVFGPFKGSQADRPARL